MNHLLKSKILEQLIYTKNLESKLYQSIFNFDINDYEIIRQKEIERVNKLNNGRKINILLKLIKDVIFDIGNISQIFNNDINKQNILKQILDRNNIKEKDQGAEDCVNLFGLKLKNNFNFGNNNFESIENNIIKEVDEEKEDESDYYSSNKKNNQNYFSKNVLDEIKECSNNINEIKNKKEQNENENDININKNNGVEELDENKKIEIMKDILINKFNENKKFEYLEKNEFLFDNKFKIKSSLTNNNEIIIEFDNNKYNLDLFKSIFCQKETNNNNKDKKNFIYTKKIMTQNEHKKHRRKKRIIDDSEEDENQII